MDLLAGELSPDEEGALRAAIQGCVDCGAEFEMMALLMDFSGSALQATAPKEMDALIMAAAEQHVRAGTTAAASTSGTWAKLGEWLESFALGPQFAMATVMVLVVAVGFWYVPKYESHEVAGSTVVLSDPEGEAVAADDPGLEPLLGAGESYRESGGLGEVERADGTPNAPEFETAAVEDTQVTPPPTKMASPMRARPIREEVNRAPSPQREQTVRTQTAMAMTRGATRMTVPSPRMTANQGNDDIEDLRSQSAAWARELEGVPMPSYSDEAPGAAAAAGGMPPSQAQQPQALGFEQRDNGESAHVETEADEVPAPSVSPSRALLQLARNHRSQARCDQAVRHYESLLARFSSSPEVPPALMESADCYRRMGRLSDAERALRRALQFASTRTSARRELTRLETIRAAQRESSAPSQESFEAYKWGH